MKLICTNIHIRHNRKIAENQYYAAYRNDFKEWINGLPCKRAGYVQTSSGYIYVTKNPDARLGGHTDFNCIVEIEYADKVRIIES